MTRLVVFLITTFFFFAACQSPLPGDDRRYLGNNLEIGINLLAQINTSYTFPLVISQTDRVSLWRLARQTPQSYRLKNQSLVNSLPIFYPGLPRGNLTGVYDCLPTESNCNQLKIANMDISQVGVYSFRVDSADFLTTKTFQFNVSALVNPVRMECVSANGSLCQVNPSTNTLSVIADQSVNIACAVDLVQNDNYPMPAQFNLMSDSYGEECMGMNSSLKPLNSSMGYTSNFNMLFSSLSKSCSRTFSIQDSSKKYTCQLNPSPASSTDAQFQPTQTYQALSVVLDVQYGPDATLPLNPIPQAYNYLFNKTIMIGSQTNFTCPFNGNPQPNFYWRVSSSSVNTNTPSNDSSLNQATDFSLSSQDYTVPRNLQVGTYVFECKAQVLGLINNYSQPIQFSLTIIPPPTPVVKKIAIINPESRYIQNENGANIGAIVGGVIGGVALLILIIVIIALFIIYGRNKRNSKDEIEKAKELDIDITDNNGSHLNPRKNAPTNGLVQQQQQQKKQQQPNGIGNKVIAGLMVPNSTAQSYAAIAHAAAAAAQSNQQRNNLFNNNSNQNNNHHNDANNFNSGSSNNLLINNNNNIKAQSYNNPGFFESTSYSIQNPLESPPPYETALHQPMTLKKDSPIQQQRLNQQQKDYMGSNSRLISETNTPTQAKHAVSNSYTAVNTPQHQNLSLVNNTTPSHLSQLGFQNQASLQYTSVHNLENRARSRNPLTGLPNEIDPNQQPQHTQYSTIAAQLSSNPIDV